MTMPTTPIIKFLQQDKLKITKKPIKRMTWIKLKSKLQWNSIKKDRLKELVTREGLLKTSKSNILSQILIILYHNLLLLKICSLLHFKSSKQLFLWPQIWSTVIPWISGYLMISMFLRDRTLRMNLISFQLIIMV